MKKTLPLFVVGILVLSGLGAVAFPVTEKNKSTSISQPTFIDEYDLIIISPNQFSTELQPLIDHKNNLGVRTILKTTEDIYIEYPGRDEPEQIKYFIKHALETWNISYVLLVGGANQLPGRYTHIYFVYDYQTEWVFLSDLYYADIYNESMEFANWDTNENDIFGEYNWYGNYDEVDLYPDVYLGRLACINEDEVTICVNKIITYETGEAYAQHWFTNLVVIGGDSLLGDEEHIDEGEFVNECVINILDGFIPTKIWASTGKLNQASNINDAINNGAGFVFFNGHGHLDIWATHSHESPEWIPPGNYRNSHVNSLTNGNKLPIVISDACYHCTHDQATDCFGWNFVTNPNGGCIGFLGGTDIDVSYGGVDIITKGIEKLCINMSTNYKTGDKTLGELWGNGISTYMTHNMDEIDYITVEEFQLFGDPSLQIAGNSEAPVKPDKPDGETEGKVGTEYTYTSRTTDPESDQLYYLFDWNDETYSGWIGPFNSSEIAEASHTWDEKGNYEINVKAKDIHGVQSEWSDPLSITMPKNKVLNLPILQFIQKLLERFPNAFPILKHMLGV